MAYMNNNKNLKKITNFLYILSMTIAFIPNLGTYKISKNVGLIIGLFWICYAFYVYVGKKGKFKFGMNRDILWLIRSYFIPPFILHLWTILLMIFGIIPWNYFSTNLGTYIPILFSIASIFLFGEKVFRWIFISLVFAYSISTISSTIFIGFKIYKNAFYDLFYNSPFLEINYLELHDIVLAIGFVLIYYIITDNKMTKQNLKIIFATLIIIFLGFKRIAGLGIVITTIFYKLIKRFSPKAQFRGCQIFGFLGILICFFFVWFIKNNSLLWLALDNLGINSRGRSSYWVALAEECDFSPSFLGKGRNYSYFLFSHELSYLHVGAAHCDILKMYVENGFFFFAYWLWHYLFRMTKRYCKRFSIESGIIYFGLTIYQFLLYFTDNVETYFITIIFSITMPVCYALKKDRSKYLQ